MPHPPARRRNVPASSAPMRRVSKADVVAGYTVPLGEGTNMKFYAKIENAFGRKYFEDGFGAPGLWGIGGVKFNF